MAPLTACAPVASATIPDTLVTSTAMKSSSSKGKESVLKKDKKKARKNACESDGSAVIMKEVVQVDAVKETSVNAKETTVSETAVKETTAIAETGPVPVKRATQDKPQGNKNKSPNAKAAPSAAVAQTTPTTSQMVTYCVEYAATNQSKCTICQRSIIAHSLRWGTMERRDRTVKKKFARHHWAHFRCFPLPAALAYRPVELVRGFTALKDKDQRRVRALVALGKGKTYRDLVAQTKREAAAAAAAAAAEAEADVDGVSGKPASNSAHIVFTDDEDDAIAKKARKQARKELGDALDEEERQERNGRPAGATGAGAGAPNKNKNKALKQLAKRAHMGRLGKSSSSGTPSATAGEKLKNAAIKGKKVFAPPAAFVASHKSSKALMAKLKQKLGGK